MGDGWGRWRGPGRRARGYTSRLMELNPERLICVSVVVCDDLYRDELTKKMVIVGTFNTISAGSLPARHPKFCVLTTLTNGLGEYQLTVVIEHEKTGNEVFRVGGPFTMKSPLDVADIDLRIHDLEFPDDGKYWVQIYDGPRIIGQRPILVRVAKPDTPGAAD